jgi:hypothetical protein
MFLTFFAVFDCIAFPQKNETLSKPCSTNTTTPLLKGTKSPLPPSLPPKIEGIEKMSVFRISNLTQQIVGSLQV